MLDRNELLDEIISSMNRNITKIEDLEHDGPDFALVRVLAEQLKEELEALYD